jgi:hypothetical protein
MKFVSSNTIIGLAIAIVAGRFRRIALVTITAGTLVSLVAAGAMAASPGKAARVGPAASKQAPAVRLVAPQGAPPRYAVVVSDSIANPALTDSSGTVQCPAGSVVYGGGVYSDSASTLTNVGGSYPFAEDTWFVDVNNGSPTDTSFQVYAICGKRMATWSLADGGTGVVLPGRQVTFSAFCPREIKVLGNGGIGGRDVDLASSYPVKSGIVTRRNFGWAATFNYGGTEEAAAVTPEVVCGKVRGYTIVKGDRVHLAPGTQGDAGVSCPAGKVPLSGSVAINSTDITTNINTSFPTADGWDTFVNNFSGPPTTITPYVVCGGAPA